MDRQDLDPALKGGEGKYFRVRGWRRGSPELKEKNWGTCGVPKETGGACARLAVWVAKDSVKKKT